MEGSARGRDDYEYEKVSPAEDDAANASGRLSLPTASFDARRDSVRIFETMADAKAAPPDRKFLYLAACIGNLASFVCGTALGWTSPEMPKLKALDDNPLGRILTPSEEGWVGAFLPLAAAIGPFAGGYLADAIGRKKTLLIGATPFILAYVLNIIATNVYYFFLSRFLCGLGVGIVFTSIPMYVGEIADDEVRGSLGAFMQLFIVIGLLFSYVFGPYLTVKIFNVVLLVPPVAFVLLFLFFVPESPYYLIQTDKTEEAEQALMKLRGSGRNVVQKEAELIRQQVEVDQRNKGGFLDIFKTRGLKMALMLSLGLVACQQLSGINIILFFAQDVFTAAGVSLAPEICTIIIGVVQILASGATPMLVEKWGKRFLLMLSGIGMGLSQGVMAYFFHLKDDKMEDISNIGWVPIVGLVVFIVAYCLGFGPLPWAVMGELFPGNIKSAASSATASGCWVLGFIVTRYFGNLTDLIGRSGSFGVFTGFCFIAALFVYKLLPETSGKSLQEIQDILNGKSKVEDHE
uniref:Putative sugar transporter n=1 Tax=Phaedon cochleariae TaxID=80249 RepID=W4VSE3_PHACE